MTEGPAGAGAGRHIQVPVLTRVEGEGALDLVISGDRIERLQLRIFEPPRLFEKLLEGRPWHEVPDIVARICGICPVAYQVTAVQAIEAAFGIEPDPMVRDWRRLMYCGEWIESHALHLHLLAAPDFLGCDSVVELAGRQPGLVERGLRLQALGNRLLALLGGRAVHPVSLRPGGFSHYPAAAELAALRQAFAQALPAARDLVRWAATLELPEDEQDFTCVALRHPHAYAIEQGDILASTGLECPVADYEHHFTETQVPHSTALHSHLQGEPYLVGPLARLNLNRDRLPPALVGLLAEAGLHLPSRNMFHSIVARAVEICLAMQEAIRLMDRVRPVAGVRVQPRAGTGIACTEAPRGILYHRYRFDARGRVEVARITPPTSQNQARMEADARRSLERLGLDQPDERLRRRAEQVIRNYDPCISCATHFLRLRVERR